MLDRDERAHAPRREEIKSGSYRKLQGNHYCWEERETEAGEYSQMGEGEAEMRAERATFRPLRGAATPKSYPCSDKFAQLGPPPGQRAKS